MMEGLNIEALRDMLTPADANSDSEDEKVNQWTLIIPGEIWPWF